MIIARMTNAGPPRRGRQRMVALAAVLGLFSAAPFERAAAETLTYVLTPMPEKGWLHVELTWDTQGRSGSALSVAKRWGAVQDIPPLVKDLRVTGVRDTQHDDASIWVLAHSKGATIRASYDVDPGRRSFDWKSIHYPIAAREMFHGIGSTFLLAPHEVSGAPKEYEVILRWELPAGWDAACSWGVGKHVGARMKPQDLRESVYLAGRLRIASATRGTDSVTVALADRFKFEAPELLATATDIIDKQVGFMREAAFPAFVITVIPVGEPLKEGDTQLSGTGLFRSFALFMAPESAINDGVEHLFAHELFHYWNGRVLTAAEPEEEVYWFTEGLTDYYSLRILYESGHWKDETFAHWINRHLRDYEANPAKNATNAEIRAKFWSERDTVGETPYQRGLMLGLRWHKVAREKGVADGFDALFLKLVERGRTGFQLTNDAIRQAGVETLGRWFGGEFDQFVLRGETPAIPGDALAPALSGKMTKIYAYEPGFDVQESIRKRLVSGLKAGSAAAKAGLKEGDELVGWSVHFNDPDKQMELKVLRKKQVQTIRFFPRGEKTGDVMQFLLAGEAKERDREGGRQPVRWKETGKKP